MNACPVCQAALRDWFEKGSRHLARCVSCGLIIVREGVARTSTGASIYEAEETVFLADGNEAYYLDHETAFTNARLKLDWVARDLASGRRLLDAGSNFGHFLKLAAERFDARGLDLSPQAVAWSREHLGVESTVMSIYALPDGLREFDAVTCWDVIEHLPDPLGALRALRSSLKPGGLLFLSTPDAGSVAARLLGRRWHYLDPLQHITVFSRENLRQALAAAGLAVLRTGTLGHSYRLRYVFDRLAYLHRDGVLGAAAVAGRWAARPLLGRSVRLDLRDVLVLTASRKDGG